MKRLTARDPAGNAYFPACFDEPCGGDRDAFHALRENYRKCMELMEGGKAS